MHIKFVIWGAGFRCKKMLLYIPHDRIIAIIESNEKLWGEEIDGIPIISINDYKECFASYPIIITPALHQKEIRETLEQNQIYNGLNFSFDIEAWFMQVDKNLFLKQCCKGKTVGICGYTVVGLLLYEYLLNNGNYNCILYTDSKNTKNYLQEYIKIDTYDSLNCDFYFIMEKQIPYVTKMQPNHFDVYNIGLRTDFYVNNTLTTFKNKHRGERIFLVATGPSLQTKDLDKLKQNEEICMSFNGIFHAFDDTDWRPTYYNVNDSATSLKWKNDILKLECKGIFVADVAWYFKENEIKKELYKYHLFREDLRAKHGKSNFSYDFSQGAYGGSTVVYSGIQIAIYMGFKKIYLLGTDCNYAMNDKSTHFYVDGTVEKFNKNQEEEGNKMILDYEVAKEYAKASGVEVYNATRGGKLEVFERIDFDTLFN